MTAAPIRGGYTAERRRLGRATTAVMWAVILVLAAGALANIALVETPTQNNDTVAFLISGAISLLFGGVGALVVNRQPRNAVGWLLWLIGALVGLSMAFWLRGGGA